MNPTLWLCASIVAAGLWSGLLLTITTILHPMFAGEDAAGMRRDLERFLPIARRSPTNYVLVLALMVAPVLAAVALRGPGDGGPFALTVVGTLLTYTGAFGLSRFAAEPNYDVILDRTVDTSSPTWAAARRRYFTLNWARAALVWSALACFASAAYLSWS